jgi:hypothetical protein
MSELENVDPKFYSNFERAIDEQIAREPLPELHMDDWTGRIVRSDPSGERVFVVGGYSLGRARWFETYGGMDDFQKYAINDYSGIYASPDWTFPPLISEILSGEAFIPMPWDGPKTGTIVNAPMPQPRVKPRAAKALFNAVRSALA